MQKAIGILIPIENDIIDRPIVSFTARLTSFCFITNDEQHGRITFDSLDSIKVSRGEFLPYKENWKESDPYYWVYKIEDSKWLKERYKYEKKHYENCYGFGGNVDKMLTDYTHYLFRFHDEFVEVITKGFWFEKNSKSLINQPLSLNHPSLKSVGNKVETIEIKGKKIKIVSNELSLEEMKKNSKFHEQRALEFYKEENDGEFSEIFTLFIFQRNKIITSNLRAPFRNNIFTKKGIMDINDIKPFLEKEIN